MRQLKPNDAGNKMAEVGGMTKDQMIESMEKINKGCKDNIENRRSALNTLVGAIPVGGKVFAIVSLDELHIDDSYQWSLQGHVKTIAKDWNPTKCDPLKINFREDGKFYVWDGQHRLEAARMRGIKYLLCDIVVGLTQAQEAELFGCQGVGIKKLCYKEEVQKRNEEKLQKKFEKDNVPGFIQTYFINIESKIGAINYWGAIKDLLLWIMERNIINKTLLSDITPNDFYEVESEDVTLYLKTKEQNGLSPTTLETRKNIFSSFWKYLKCIKKCPVNENIIKSISYKGISYSNNIVRKLPSEEQLKMMEDKIMNKKEDFVRIRNLIILRVLKGTGLRESELAGLDISDLYLDDEMPYIKIIGKGKCRAREARTVYLTGDAAKAFNEWLAFRSGDDNIIDNNAVF